MRSVCPSVVLPLALALACFAGNACTGEGRPAPRAPRDPANPRAPETPFDAGVNPLVRAQSPRVGGAAE